MKIMYGTILVGEVITNQSLSVDGALEIIGFNEEVFTIENNINDLDYNDFKLSY